MLTQMGRCSPEWMWLILGYVRVGNMTCFRCLPVRYWRAANVWVLTIFGRKIAGSRRGFKKGAS